MATTKSQKLPLSIFFPVYNDWGTIATMASLAVFTARQVSDDFEVILVDDGSEEKTQAVLKIIEERFPEVRVIHHPKNKGYGGALRTGFKESKKEFIFYTDGDAQYNVLELLNLVAEMKNDIDVVNGWKIKRNDPFYRILTGKTYQYLTKLLFNLPIRDVDCDFRLMRKRVFDHVTLESNSGTICVEMIKKITDCGCKFAEVPVHHFFRASGKSEFFNYKRLLRVARDIVKWWWRLVVKKEAIKSAINR